MSKRNKLKKLVIKELSLVDRPANAGARVSIWKRHDPDSDAAKAAHLNLEAGELDMKTIEELSKALEEAEARMEALEKSADEAKATIETLTKEKAEIQKALDEAKAAKEEDPEAIDKAALPEPVRKALEQAEADSKAAVEAIAKAEAREKAAADAAATATAIEKAKGYANLPIKAEEFGPVLKRAADALSAEDMTEIDRILKAADEAFATVTAQVGTDKPAAGSADEKLDTLAKAYAKEHKVTYAKAYDEVLKANPDLYKQHRVEKGLDLA